VRGTGAGGQEGLGLSFKVEGLISGFSLPCAQWGGASLTRALRSHASDVRGSSDTASGDTEEEEEEEDFFIFNDTIEGPTAPAVKPSDTASREV
jgi:hypothetical protein